MSGRRMFSPIDFPSAAVLLSELAPSFLKKWNRKWYLVMSETGPETMVSENGLNELPQAANAPRAWRA